jgi:hypothetical protein
MGDLHAMVIEDEILLCGIVLALGIATGAIARFLSSLRQKKAARAGSV